MSLPNVDVYFDSGLIPSLSENGGVGHHALMGRPILPLLQTTTPSAFGPDIAAKEGKGKHQVKRVGKDLGSGSCSDDEDTAKPERRVPRLTVTRPKPHRRTSSLDGRSSTGISVPSIQSRSGSRSRSRAESESELELKRRGSDNRPDHHSQSSYTIPRLIPCSNGIAPGQLLHPPTLTHPTSNNNPSRELLPTPPPKSSKHTRSSSWSAPLSITDTTILLNPSASSPHPTTLLTELQALIPLSRVDPLAPPPSSSALHPPILLAGLAFVLEALVGERTILSSSSSSSSTCATPEMPLLQDHDKSTLRLPSGGLDWSAFQTYLCKFGPVLRKILTLIMGSEISEGALDLVEMVKIYITKIRKVFGEVAGMYMYKYSFVGGWWDDRAMRRSAREVGDWGEMIDKISS